MAKDKTKLDNPETNEPSAQASGLNLDKEAVAAAKQPIGVKKAQPNRTPPMPRTAAGVPELGRQREAKMLRSMSMSQLVENVLRLNKEVFGVERPDLRVNKKSEGDKE